MSSVEVGTAYVSLIPSAKGFASRMQSELGGEVASIGSKGGEDYSKGFAARAKKGLGGAAKGMFAPLVGAAVGLFAFDKAKDFIAGAVDEARESQVVGARTANVLKKMGATAWTSANQIGNLATALSNKVGIDDEAIQAGENLLLTFGNIRNEAGKGNDIFNQTTKLMVDMSAAMGKDAKSSAIGLGKALNDPVKGVTALTRVGVSFTQHQKDQIKTLVDSGKTLAAQKIILREVGKEFGGAAAKMATPGQKMSVAWGNLKEQIGTALLPVLNRAENFITRRVVPAVSRFITQMQNGRGAGGRFVDKLKQIGNTLKNVATFLNKHRSVVAAVVAAYVAFRLILVGIAVAQRVSAAATAIATGAQVTYNAAVALSRSYIATWLGVKALELAAWVRGTAAAVASTTATVASTIAQKAAAGAAKAWAAAQWLLNAAMDANPITLIVIALVALVAGFIVAYKKVGWFRDAVNGLMKGIGKAVSWVVGFIKQHWGLLLAIIGGPLGLIVALVIKNFGRIKSTITNAMHGAKAVVTSVWHGITGIVTNGGTAIVNAVRAIPGKLSALGGLFLTTGKNIIGQFVSGLKNTGKLAANIAGDIWNAVKGQINAGIDAINSFLEFTIHIKAAPDIHVNPPDIPHLATGGRAFGGSLAVIGEGREPETVFPDSVLGGFLERMAAASSSGGGGFPDTVRLVVDGAEFTAYVEGVSDGRVSAQRHLDAQARRSA